MSAVHIIGIGSPYGEDQIAWQAIDYLQQTLFARSCSNEFLRLSRFDRPSTRLLSAMQGSQLSILIDAARGAGTRSHIRRFEVDAIDEAARLVSPHALTRQQSQELGEEVDVLPAYVVILAIEMPGEFGTPDPAGADHAPSFTALEQLVAQVVSDFRPAT
ncbi:MAG: hypothetical protein JSW10_10740 [Pseudomonadota bacterium]|nr:MAG: hypothetical protein JSW10_10740 [Pseudomonadota bacterium]